MKSRGLWLTGFAAIIIFAICAILLSTVFTQSKDSGAPLGVGYGSSRSESKADIGRIRHIVLITEPESPLASSVLMSGDTKLDSRTNLTRLAKSAKLPSGREIPRSKDADPSSLPEVLGATGISWQYYVTAPPNQNRSRASQPETKSNRLAAHVVPGSRFIPDAEAGRLPSVSVLAASPDSEGGEKAIGQQIKAVLDSPEWASSALFVEEPDGVSYRILSPYSPLHKAPGRDVDAGSAEAYDLAAFLRFIEVRFNLPLTGQAPDSGDVLDAFDFNQAPALQMALPNWINSRFHLK